MIQRIKLMILMIGQSFAGPNNDRHLRNSAFDIEIKEEFLPWFSSISFISLFDRLELWPLLDGAPLLFVCAPNPIVSSSIGGPLMQPFRNCSKFKLLPYLPRTYISNELYGMPKSRDAWLVVIFLFHTWCNASVNSAFVQERGGPPRGAECWPFGRLTAIHE